MTTTNENVKEEITPSKKTERNSLLELYRFLFSLWVVYYHGFLVRGSQFFNHGYIAVEFFFILSGFYLLKSIDKQITKPFFTGLFQLIWKRIKALGLAFIIGLIFVVYYMVLEGEISLLGYLWYIPFMLLAFAVIYFLRRFIKNPKIFVSILVLIVVISYLLLYIPVLEGWGLFRALGGVSLGVLVSFIPQLKLKIKNFNFNWIITLLLFGLVLFLACLPKTNLISEYFLVFLIMPMLIYFTNTLTINCKFLNFLGSLSFGLYAYQCPLRVLEFYVPLAEHWFFLILLGFILLDKIIIYLFRLILKKYKSKRNIETKIPNDNSL